MKAEWWVCIGIVAFTVWLLGHLIHVFFWERLWRKILCRVWRHDPNIGALSDPDAPLVLYCRRCGKVLDERLNRWLEGP